MRSVAAAALFVLAGSLALAQPARGVLSGTVTDPDGAVNGATVQAKEHATGKMYTATTGRRGDYRLRNLPAGTYDVSVPPLGFRTNPFEKKDVSVASGKMATLDIVLRRGNQGVLGDDNAYLAIRNKYGNLTGRAPRMPDGRPDLSGVWNANVDPNPEPVSLLPWAQKELDARRENRFRDQPSARCLPDDPTSSLPLLYKLVQTKTLLVALFEQEPHYRQVYLDGRQHPQEADPSWMGHSTAAWEKDTLVIDTAGFNDKSWLTGEGYPHTEMLHMIERYRRPDLGHLEIELTLEDPGAFAKPIKRHMTWELAPREDILESVCNENNKYAQNAGLK